MSCLSELRGLGEVDAALRARGGGVLAITASRPGDLARMAHDQRLGFEVLADPSAATVRAYGLLHEAGGPDGEDICVPANFLVRREGEIAWRFVAHRINSRATPDEVLSAVEALDR